MPLDALFSSRLLWRVIPLRYRYAQFDSTSKWYDIKRFGHVVPLVDEPCTRARAGHRAGDAYVCPFAVSSRRGDEEPFPVPDDVQRAIDEGLKDEVEKLLATPPEGMSKALKKKLIKQAEINAKKLEKSAGKPAVAAPPPSAKKAAAAAAAAAAPGAAAASQLPAAPPPASSAMPVGASERAIVELLLERMQTLGLPAEAINSCREHQAALGLAIAPQLNTLRNEAYVTGFNARTV